MTTPMPQLTPEQIAATLLNEKPITAAQNTTSSVLSTA